MTALDLDALLALREKATVHHGDSCTYCTSAFDIECATEAILEALPELVERAREADRLRAEVDEGAIYDRLLAERRADCYCRPYSKPCTECGAFADGIVRALAALSDGGDQ